MTLVADVLVVVGLVVCSLAVLGLYRMPDVFSQVQAAAKASSLGVVALLAAAACTGGATAAKAVLVAAFLVLTSPVGAHAIARAARRRDEPLHRGPEDRHASSVARRRAG